MRILDKIVNGYIPSLFFNLRHFPFKVALKMPVLIYKVKVKSMSGHFEFAEGVDLRRGMVKIGYPETSLHDGMRYIIENSGTIVFNGPCHLGYGGVLSVGKSGLLEMGANTIISDGSRIICFHHIHIGDKTTAGWDCSFCDTDFHSMKNAFTGKKLKAYAPIIIGDANWLGENVTVLKGTVTPAYTTVSACSMLNKKYKCEEKSILLGNPANVVSEGCFYRDMDDDRVEYVKVVR